MSGPEGFIAAVPLFSGLSKKHMSQLVKTLKERTFPAGHVITHDGQEGVGFFLIDSGSGTVTKGDKVLRTLNSGDYFGEIALIDSGPRTAQVTADTELRCWTLASWDFRAFVQGHPEVAWELLQQLAARLREAEDRTFV